MADITITLTPGDTLTVRVPPDIKEPAVALAKVVAIDEWAPGGCVSIPVAERVLNWTTCYICDPEHAAAQHVCEKHLLELQTAWKKNDQPGLPSSADLDTVAEEISLVPKITPNSWDDGHVEIHEHGKE